MLSIRSQTFNTILIFFKYLAPFKSKYHHLIAYLKINDLKIIVGDFFTNGRLLLLLLLFTVFANAREFSVSVLKTDETCSGNGSITMNVINANPGAAISYSIYYLPGTTPIAILRNTNVLDRLTSGNYRIVATQSNSAASASQEISIESAIIPLSYTISGTNITCGNLGTMTASVFSGTGAFYEIISGPVVAPQQTSPTFNNLLPGEYRMRVTDSCGQGWVMTHTLFTVTPQLAISNAAFPVAELPACNSIILSNVITPARNTALTYPLRIDYTILPAGGGAPKTINRVITSGATDVLEVQTAIPFFYNQPYSYTITVTDKCSNPFQRTGTINQKMKIGLNKVLAKCGTYALNVDVSNHKPPYRLNFLSWPAGFVPPPMTTHTTSPVSFGDFDNPVPFGYYKVEITDACGRSETADATIVRIIPVPTITPVPLPGCRSDKSNVTAFISGYKIVSALLTPLNPAGPSRNVTSMIDTDGKLLINLLSAGDYKLTLQDDCGNPYNNDFTVADLNTTVKVFKLVSCDLGKGSLRIRGENVDLQNVVLTRAPRNYTGIVPENVSRFINSNPEFFSMSGLVPGDYYFDITDSCNALHREMITVDGYTVTSNTYSVAEHCGSFDLMLANVDNSNAKYWLQKFNPANNTWGHPETNIVYTDGSKPTVRNSYALTNSGTTYNIGYNGNFRIVKFFESYENGNVGLIRNCSEVIQSFTFFGALDIMSIDKTTCNGLNSDVTVNAVGSGPLRYVIEAKNGLPFTIDNINNPLFTNLEPGVYKFVVYDNCTNFTSRFIDVGLLPSILSTIKTPGNLVSCENSDDNSKAEFDLTRQNAEILGLLDATVYNITYHISPGDATTDINPLPDLYTSENTTIYARVEYNNRNDCYGIVSFDAIVNEIPVLQMAKNYFICPNDSVTITADPGYLNYSWSTGELNVQQITVRRPGIYELTVTEIQNGQQCSTVFKIDVVLSEIATVNRIEITHSTDNENAIAVIIDQPDSENYSYSLDNQNFQSSNTFSGLKPGNYEVYINDRNGCPSEVQKVSLLNYQKFFTPNADGFNDYWKIINSESEPGIEVSIFDRYGKLLKVLNAYSEGWNGTFNGRQVSASDYWFVVKRADGKIQKGHFSIKR